VTGADSREVPAAAQAPGGAVFDNSEGAPGEAAGPPRRRRHPVRTSLIVLAAIAVAAAGGIAATGALGGGGGNAPAAASSGPARTAQVEQTTLTRSETVDGTLGYGGASSVQAASGGSEPAEGAGAKGGDSGDSGGSAGTLTWLPGEGDVIKRGEPVYRVNEDKVPLLYGSTPLYRTLKKGVEGGDVVLLEKNLAALGYTGFTVDEEYTSATADAVRAWQEDLGREENGTLAAGDVVVASGAKRVAEVTAARGAAASGEVLTWTGTQRLVTVDLETQYEDLVKEGTKATVKLPDGSVAQATVTDVGNAATAKPAEGGGSSDTATLPVRLSVKDQKKLGRYQAAPVDVTLAAESRKNVLAVPVNALLARKGGGYAVQAVTTGGVESRPVKLGLFANGMVEISGDGITKGLKVGIPQ
jgi:hypothetical protein